MHLTDKSNAQDVVEQSLTVYPCDIFIQKDKEIKNKCLDPLKFSYPLAFHIIVQ